MGTCLIPNCRKQTPSSEPFCVDHRDLPTWEQKYNAAMHNWTIDSNAKEAEIAALQSRLDSAVEGNRSATQALELMAQRAELADNGRRAAVERALGLQEQLSVVTIERDAADEGLTELRIELQEQQSRLSACEKELDGALKDVVLHDRARLVIAEELEKLRTVAKEAAREIEQYELTNYDAEKLALRLREAAK